MIIPQFTEALSNFLQSFFLFVRLVNLYYLFWNSLRLPSLIFNLLSPFDEFYLSCFFTSRILIWFFFHNFYPSTEIPPFCWLMCICSFITFITTVGKPQGRPRIYSCWLLFFLFFPWLCFCACPVIFQFYTGYFLVAKLTSLLSLSSEYVFCSCRQFSYELVLLNFYRFYLMIC